VRQRREWDCADYAIRFHLILHATFQARDSRLFCVLGNFHPDVAVLELARERLRKSLRQLVISALHRHGSRIGSVERLEGHALEGRQVVEVLSVNGQADEGYRIFR
jgi:hypothetical protein